jgi:sugar phosphate isomerase/epimerase
MKYQFCKGRWEYGQVPFRTYLDRVVADGFDGAESSLLALAEPPEEIKSLIADHGLILIAQIHTHGKTPDEHQESMTHLVHLAQACGARFVNCHTGSDFFSFEDNVALLRHAKVLADDFGLPVLHETHRGRALFSLPDTLCYLEVLPELELTADLSHFMCVHESELRDRKELLDRVIARTRHIHARVGFAEGPQVPHPLAPEWSGLLEHYLDLWKRMAAVITESGFPAVTITPEAGPPGYMPVLPFTNMPVADAWTVNVQMKDWLKTRLE